MKWVKIREGNYRLVEDDDERPAVDLPNKEGAPNIQVAPPWKRYEKGQIIGTPDEQFESSEKFTQEREHAMKTDPKWKKWEESRKKSLAKDKPAWRKDRIKKIEDKKRQEAKKIVDQIL